MKGKRVGQILKEMKSILSCEAHWIDSTGKICESTNKKDIGSFHDQILVQQFENNILVGKGYTYCLINSSAQDKGIVAVKRTDQETIKILRLMGLMTEGPEAECTLDELLKKLLSEGDKNGEGLERCKNFGISHDDPIQVMAIRVQPYISQDVDCLLRGLHPDALIVWMEDTLLVVIVKTDKLVHCDFAQGIYAAIATELLYEATVGVGSISYGIREIKTSYERARRAAELGEAVYQKKKVYHYESLIIPRLIRESHHSLQEYQKTLQGISAIVEQEELLQTIQVFFENNLNISETARLLYIHRNTLIYRLNKILKLSGYDMRVFSDAVNFYIIMLMYQHNHSDYNQQLDVKDGKYV